MGNANLNISVIEKRMLNQTESAAYTGMPVKHFKTTCPVQPLEMGRGIRCWDKRDLDRWIDDMKQGTEMTTRDAILGKL
ncbi:hypothetical protein [Rhodovulum sulfidophilum]|uniref:hypothetical protein n=1 Tax=Rhodovulum sulfidophilum TaxID=35806 RepID=UPI0009534D75|nr:hypothetical protein [Rhodovulum sulfidophilum]MBL3553854.1 hypothetical protein [Rhodovulum sulfidophilum]MBL3564607.1 hypothetical protein [Rhodovulum sulfidophilum]MBL3587335.1 hypothetical protein [Rhodovulum sulfidophilum]MCE8418979.1 hypothetical protein [Rhodovulum sulfidophilum]OLS46993.1 hypothetical protein BV379_00940 [Rhodovulum sulfidophilum]